MSKLSINQILENIQEQKKQEEITSFKKYISNLKPGDLVFVKGRDIISEIRFTEHKVGDNECELNLKAGADKKHIQDVSDYDYLGLGEQDKTYPALVIEKAYEYEHCSCFFLLSSYIKQTDVFVLIDTKFYYVRIRPDNNELSYEDYEMDEEMKYTLK